MRNTQWTGMLKRTVVAAGALLAMGSIANAQQTVSVGGIYGGVWADSIRAAFLDPYGVKSKTQMKIEEGISGVTLAKLRQQKDNPQFDVVWMDRVVSNLGDADVEAAAAPALALAQGKYVHANNSGYDNLDPHAIFDVGRAAIKPPVKSIMEIISGLSSEIQSGHSTATIHPASRYSSTLARRSSAARSIRKKSTWTSGVRP